MAAVTLAMIASEAGVSRPVVSKVLHGGTTTVGVSPATEARVLDVAAALGYRLNTAARAISRGRFDALGLVIGTRNDTSQLPSNLLHGILAEAQAQGVHMTIDRLPDEKLSQDGFVPRFLSELVADGLLIDFSHMIPAPMLDLLVSSPMPCVWLNSMQPKDAVYPDDVQGGRLATGHLLRLGHRRIAFYDDSDRVHYSSNARFEGYCATMSAAGVAPLAFREYLPERQLLEALLAFLRETRPTALIPYDKPWFPLLAASRLGWRIPEDLSVVCFAGKAFRALGYNFTTAVIPQFEEGREAVRMLLRRIADPATPLSPVALPFSLDVQATGAPPRKD